MAAVVITAVEEEVNDPVEGGGGWIDKTRT